MKYTFLSKVELAQAYFPYMNPVAARNKLMSIIGSAHGDIMQKLLQTGYRTHQHDFTPAQVSIIMEHLGNPFR